MIDTSKGYIILARKIMESDIWDKPAWWFKVWIYILLSVNYADTKNMKRGSGFFTYESIYRDCKLKKYGVKNPKCCTATITALKLLTMILTQKLTRGFIITVCNYNQYQNRNIYKIDTNIDNKNDSRLTQDCHRIDTITEVNKEVKELKNNNNTLEAVASEVFPSQEVLTETPKTAVIVKTLPIHVQFVEQLAKHYEEKTGQPYKTDKKQYIISAGLVKKFGIEAVINKCQILAEACSNQSLWFTKQGWADFTIEKLSSRWNELLKPAIKSIDWLEELKKWEEKKNVAV